MVSYPVCHCEEGEARRGALSTKCEEMPLGCNPYALAAKLPLPYYGSKERITTASLRTGFVMTGEERHPHSWDQPGSKISPHIRCQLGFQIDQPFGDVFGTLAGGFILVQIAVQGFDTHIAAIGHEIGHGAV